MCELKQEFYALHNYDLFLSAALAFFFCCHSCSAAKGEESWTEFALVWRHFNINAAYNLNSLWEGTECESWKTKWEIIHE